MPKRKAEVTAASTPASVVAPPPEVDVDTLSDTVTQEQLAATSGRTKNRPDISGLPDAVVDGRPIFVRGDKIVIERRVAMFADHPYLDTRAYHVNAVDMETGRVELFDETLMQHARDNWIEGLRIGQVYKLTTNARVDVGKRKRGRPRKNPIAPAAAPATPGEKKKRGRPKGSKNRTKDVIAAEKTERKLVKAAKVAAKKAKRK